MLGHKTTLNKFKQIEVISSIFFNYNGMKLEINIRKRTGKFTKCGNKITHSWISNTSKLNLLVNELKKESKEK